MKHFIFTLIILTLAGCGGDSTRHTNKAPEKTQPEQTTQNQEETFPADEFEQLKESVTLKNWY